MQKKKKTKIKENSWGKKAKPKDIKFTIIY